MTGPRRKFPKLLRLQSALSRSVAQEPGAVARCPLFFEMSIRIVISYSAWSRSPRGTGRGMKFSVQSFAHIFLVALFSVCLSFAQQITGSVTGTVTDPGGAAVSGASVKLTNTGTDATQTATTDAEGNFRFLLLPPGNYSVQVSAPGFKSYVRAGIVVARTWLT